MHLQVFLHPYTGPRLLQNLLVEFHIEMYNRFLRLKMIFYSWIEPDAKKIAK